MSSSAAFYLVLKPSYGRPFQGQRTTVTEFLPSWSLLGLTGFDWVLLGLTGFDWVLDGFVGTYIVEVGALIELPRFTGF